MNIQKPKVSVIIPVYNGEKYISAAIESVLIQSYKNIEVVVIDDGSTDDTFEKIKPFLPHIRYIYQENSGVSNARNNGILNSKSELVSFLDHDDVWFPDKIKKQVNYLLCHPDEKFVHCGVKYINHEGSDINPAGYWGNLTFTGEVENIEEIIMHFAMLPSAMMIKKEVFDEVGLFNPEFVNCEGYDLCLRIALKHKLCFINEPLVLYRLHDSNTSSNFIRFDFFIIKTLESFLGQHPDICRKIGRKKINMRLYNIYYEMAENCKWLKNYTEAKRYYWKAYKTYPLNINCLNKYFWCLIPPSQRKNLNWYKNKLKIMLVPK